MTSLHPGSDSPPDLDPVTRVELFTRLHEVAQWAELNLPAGASFYLSLGTLLDASVHVRDAAQAEALMAAVPWSRFGSRWSPVDTATLDVLADRRRVEGVAWGAQVSIVCWQLAAFVGTADSFTGPVTPAPVVGVADSFLAPVGAV